MMHMDFKKLKDRVVTKFNKTFHNHRASKRSPSGSGDYDELPNSSRRTVRDGVTSLYDVPPPGVRPVLNTTPGFPVLSSTSIDTSASCKVTDICPEKEWFNNVPELWDTDQTMDMMIDGLLDPDEEKEKLSSTVLIGDYDPKNFLEQIPAEDTSGNELPPWKRMLMAKQMAEKEYHKAIEMKRKQEEEEKYKNMPVWKRAIIKKREEERKSAAAISDEQEMK